MNEYISREAAINAVKTLESSMPAKDNYAKGYDAAIGRVLIAVREVPSATDVQPIKHGRWIWDSNAPHREYGAYKCSNCGCHSDFEENYCPNCGARMDLDSVTHDRCSNYMDCDGHCFIDDTPCDCDGNIEKCKGR